MESGTLEMVKKQLSGNRLRAHAMTFLHAVVRLHLQANTRCFYQNVSFYTVVNSDGSRNKEFTSVVFVSDLVYFAYSTLVLFGNVINYIECGDCILVNWIKSGTEFIFSDIVLPCFILHL